MLGFTFTAQRAYERSVEEHNPIWIPHRQAEIILKEHGQTLESYLAENSQTPIATKFDAWRILRWLGY